MPTRFLEFDQSEDTEGLHSWDALASPAPAYTGDLLAEVQALLLLLTQRLGPAGPVDEGHRWDMDLQIHDEAGRPLTLETHPTFCGRVTLALSLSGGAALADGLTAFEAR